MYRRSWTAHHKAYKMPLHADPHGDVATEMLIYKSTVSGFLSDFQGSDIGDVVRNAYESKTQRHAPEAEIRAWSASLYHMAITVNNGSIPDDAGVAVEYSIPQSAKRIDFIFSGYDQSHNPVLVIVELKQWSSSEKTNKPGVIIARRGPGSGREGPHPSYQAWSYAALLNGFNEEVYSRKMGLFPCAYLHNHPANTAIDSPFYMDDMKRAPLFLKGEHERRRLSQFISQHVRHGDAAKVIEQVDGGRMRPSKALADSITGMLKGKQEFVLIDDQKVVFESVCATAARASDTNKKVVIVEGGPGTGKSVVAVNILAALTKMGLLTKYVSKNAAPRAVYKAKLTGNMRYTEISNLFCGSGAFVDTDPNAFNVLVVDEAHRLNEKSGLYGNLGENQVKELIRSAHCTVFFLDEDQAVTLSDIGTKEEIRRWAESMGATVESCELSSQFRCNGADGYLAWLDNTLGIRKTAHEFLGAGTYDFRVLDSPTELHELIYERDAKDNGARVVAGYCWNWSSKKDPSAVDIVLEGGAYRRRWNRTEDGSLWMIARTAVEEIGCIHTCQGLEADYIGVIIGPDLVVRDGKVSTDYKARALVDRRKSLSGIEKIYRQNPEQALKAADRIIKNTYRTLMTRGMKGCYVYSEDPETRAYFASRAAVV